MKIVQLKIVQPVVATVATLATCIMSTPQASALTFTEATDAGKLLNTATDVGAIDRIEGEISEQLDIDLFKFTLTQAGQSTFAATPIPAADGSQLNINLFLFNAMGNPLASIEPVDSDSMTINIATQAGTYFLGIGSDDLDAFDRMGRRIAGNDSGIEITDGILADWTPGNESIGKYSIQFSTIPNAPGPIDPTAVPTPALLPGLIGLGLKLKRRQQKIAAHV